MVRIGSHPTRGAWIEIICLVVVGFGLFGSHPTRGAWIEIRPDLWCTTTTPVAPHTGCVD